MIRWKHVGSIMLVTVALAGFTGLASAQESPMGGMMGPGMMKSMGHGMMGGPRSWAERPLITFMLRHQEDLKLTPEQKEALTAIRSEFQKGAIRQSAEIQVAEVELRELLGKEPVDLGLVEAALRKVESLHVALRLGRIKAIEKGRSLLNADQQKTLQALLEKEGMSMPMGGMMGQSMMQGMMGQGGMMGQSMMQGMMGQGMGPQAKVEQAGPSASSQTRTNEAGGVTVEATYRGLIGDGKLGIAVKLDTHSVPLDAYPIEQLALLRNDTGEALRALGWENPQGSGHHRSGLLTFPAADASGRPFIGQETRSVELILKDLAGVRERVLRWDLR
ncbi:MAG: periplasmic heavy metal sensor [candidate division NC10 bacterium]|nr:periplasmic heavy metal sensor [candidate division NC10 bacterium]